MDGGPAPAGLSLVPFLSVLAGSLRVLLLSESKHCLDFYKCYIRFKCAPQSFPRAKLVKKKKKAPFAKCNEHLSFVKQQVALFREW